MLLFATIIINDTIFFIFLALHKIAAGIETGRDWALFMS